MGHEIPTALLPSLITATLGAPASALGLIEGISDGLAGAARLAGGAVADDPRRRRAQAVAGCTTTAVLSSLIGTATAVWQVGVFRAGAWAARGLASPPPTPCWPTACPPSVYGRAYGFERAMDNLGAIAGPLLALALALVGLVGTRTAIALSIIPGLLAALVIVFGLAYAGFVAGGSSVPALAPWFVTAGVAIGCVETAGHAAVAALAPVELRGSAFGLLAGRRP